jgi:hypothetical protein
MREWRWIRRYQLIQYTMYAPRRFSPLLRETIVRVLSHTRRHIGQSSSFRRPQYKEKTILEVTGPGVFTDVVLDVLSQTLPPTHKLVESSVDSDAPIGDLVFPSTGVTQRRVTWAPFHGIRDPVCVDPWEVSVCYLSVYGAMDKGTVVPRVSTADTHVSIIALGGPGGRAGWSISLGRPMECFRFTADRHG